MKRLLAMALVGVVLMAGCIGPESKGKSHDVDEDELLKGHLQVTCTLKASSAKGLDAWLVGCDNGKFVPQPLAESKVTWSGHNSAEGAGWNDRIGTIAAGVYYPGNNGNDPLSTVKYTMDPKEESSFTSKISFPLESGYGAYSVCFFVTKQVETKTWWPGYQYQSQDKDPECQRFNIARGGIFG